MVVRLVATGGNTLLYQPHEGIDDASVQVFLMGSGLGALLMQRALLVMHGNAVAIGDTCIMCVGPSGTGKSTTAAGLMQRGFQVISDDVCAINGQGQIIPGMPHIKLWQDTADQLQLATTDLARIRPMLEKFSLPLEKAFCEDAMPVQSIYLLTPRRSDTITLQTLSTPEVFKALRGNTYRLAFVGGMGLSVDHFQHITALAQRVTVKRLYRPAVGFQLDQMLDVLIADATSARSAQKVYP